MILYILLLVLILFVFVVYLNIYKSIEFFETPNDKLGSGLPLNDKNINIQLLLDHVNKIVKKNIDKERVLKLTKKKNIKCKYYPSYSQGFVCPERYPNHLGASFGAPCSSGLLCNGKKIKSERATVYCIVKNGNINDIRIINKGNGYIGNPKIKINGNGTNAEAKCETDSEGGISNIKIINQGHGYTETPKIKIEKPNGYMYCHLCCNKL